MRNGYERASKKTNLGGVLKCPTVNTVVSRIETALGEPDDVACRKRARSDCLERAVPVKRLAGNLER